MTRRWARLLAPVAVFLTTALCIVWFYGLVNSGPLFPFLNYRQESLGVIVNLSCCRSSHESLHRFWFWLRLKNTTEGGITHGNCHSHRIDCVWRPWLEDAGNNTPESSSVLRRDKLADLRLRSCTSYGILCQPDKSAAPTAQKAHIGDSVTNSKRSAEWSARRGRGLSPQGPLLHCASNG